MGIPTNVTWPARWRRRGGGWSRGAAVVWWSAACVVMLCGGCSPSADASGAAPAARFPPPEEARPAAITIVTDHVPYHDDLPLSPELDVSILIEAGAPGSKPILYDAALDGARVMANLRRLGHDPARISAVVISHFPSTHWQGLRELLGAIPDLKVFLPEEPTDDVREYLGDRSWKWEVADAPTEVTPGVFTTGAFPGRQAQPGQGVVAHTPLGSVVIMGCGDPRPVELARRVHRLTGSFPLMVGGGFIPTGKKRDHEKWRTAAALRALGVPYLAVFHHTVTDSVFMTALRRTWGTGCLEMGNGAEILFEPGAPAPRVRPAPIIKPSALSSQPSGQSG